MAKRPIENDSKASEQQLRWLRRGCDQPAGKLPLFDDKGRKVSERTVKSCIERGWAEPWFANPLKPDWLICKLTDAGRDLVN
ncbi:MAG: hypothetical protein HQ513_08365 [Rhodospirillales bacterium]|nr:hypothetical protein [Rhodospirillales bacterium]